MAKKAKKAKKAKAKKRTTNKPKSVTTGVRPGSIDAVEPIYSNYVQARVGPNDIALLFCQAIGPDPADMAAVRKKGYIEADPKSALILPIPVAQALLRLLQDTLPPAEDE